MFMKSAGYSAVPLAKKLGIKSLTTIRIIHAPEYYFDLFNDLPPGIKEVVRGNQKVDFLHYFTMNRSYLQKDIRKIKSAIKKEGTIWISWPKKSSGIITDINENTVREIALKNGLVDVKVCAIDEVWSALKLVVPVKERGR
jgi:hypothetical protein